MPAALDIRPRKREELGALAAHAFRHGAPAASVDPDLTHLNRVLLGHIGVEGALRALPGHQPDGRKIRNDANLGASMIFTLPQELEDGGEEALANWQQATMDWAKAHMPGQLVYATLHLDEPNARPHVHALSLAIDDKGAFNYRALFHRPRDLFKRLQESYGQTLSPLGVKPNSPEVKAALKPTYTPFANPEGKQISASLRAAPDEARALAEAAEAQARRKAAAEKRAAEQEALTEAQRDRARALIAEEEVLASWRDRLLAWREQAMAVVREGLVKGSDLLARLAVRPGGRPDAPSSAQPPSDPGPSASTTNEPADGPKAPPAGPAGP